MCLQEIKIIFAIERYKGKKQNKKKVQYAKEVPPKMA